MTNSKWTRFMDMHSGGGNKIKPYEFIYIEAPQDEAEVIFYNRFGRNPNRVTCTCCGEDYSVSEVESIEEGSKWDRKWGKPNNQSLEDYLKMECVLVIRADEIEDSEREGELESEGYVWAGG